MIAEFYLTRIPPFLGSRPGRPALFTAALLVALAASSLCAAPPRPPDGKRIFQKQCASCHGAKGEGVKDKYGDPLTGDWSVAKLSRYVQANMPEDKPESLSAPEAQAV
jgi:mono/diheme cytochrome c family protein